MKIRLASSLQSDSIVDGNGIRTVLWTQGCLHNCPFCHNPGTHDFKGGFEVDVKSICNEIRELKYQDGITLSGGDPLYQIDAILEIVKFCQKINLNVWCYTGFTFEQIITMSKKNKKYLEFLNNIDVLVDGKFEIKNKSFNVLFRGSTNQRLINVKKTIKSKKIILLEENDGIMDQFDFKEKVYI